MGIDRHFDGQLELIYDVAPGRSRQDRVGVERSETGWCYRWEGARNGGLYLFDSQVSRSGGVDGGRRRLELTSVVRDLLHWSVQESRIDEATDRRA